MGETVDFQKIKSDQEQNAFITQNKELFFAMLNSFLDQLYDATDAEDVAEEAGSPGVMTDETFKNVKGLEETVETMRKKIHNEAPLSQGEILNLVLITQHVTSTLEYKGKELLEASQQLNSLKNGLLKI